MPKDDMILDLRSQIDAMEDELNEVTRSQTELAIQLDDTKVHLETSLQNSIHFQTQFQELHGHTLGVHGTPPLR